MKLIICFFAFTAFFNLSFCFVIQPKAGCTVSINGDLSDPQPLLLIPGTKTFFMPIDTKGTIEFSANQNVRLVCPGTGNYLKLKGSGVQEAVATCISGTTFNLDGLNVAFNQFTCNRYPDHLDRKTGSKCLGDKTEIEVGFDLSSGFIQHYIVCHDEVLKHTIYAKSTLHTNILGFQSGFPRPDWENGNFFQGIDPTNLYKRATQRVTFAKLLSSTALAEKYIHLTNDYFLSKGHLVAKADFVFGSQHRLTFYYVNASPQWQTFNGANWNALENDARSVALKQKTDIDIYTGTHGLATLPDNNGNQVPLYLSVDSNNNVAMPVPRMFWKVFHNPVTKAGIAFVGLNNPYQTLASAKADVLCTDICSQISWLTWDQFNLIKGYSYCCEVSDFRRAFPELPAFEVTSILK